MSLKWKELNKDVGLTPDVDGFSAEEWSVLAEKFPGMAQDRLTRGQFFRAMWLLAGGAFLAACANNPVLGAALASATPTAPDTPRPTNSPEPMATATRKPTEMPEPSATATKTPTKTPEPSATPSETPKPTDIPEPIDYASFDLVEIGRRPGAYFQILKERFSRVPGLDGWGGVIGPLTFLGIERDGGGVRYAVEGFQFNGTKCFFRAPYTILSRVNLPGLELVSGASCLTTIIGTRVAISDGTVPGFGGNMELQTLRTAGYKKAKRFFTSGKWDGVVETIQGLSVVDLTGDLVVVGIKYVVYGK